MACEYCLVDFRVSEFEGVSCCDCVMGFSCTLCGNRCKRVNMLQHVGSEKHRRKVVELNRAAQVVHRAVAVAVELGLGVEEPDATLVAPEVPEVAALAVEVPVVVVAQEAVATLVAPVALVEPVEEVVLRVE